MSLPSLAEVEHADWTSLQRMCENLGLNPKGRSAVVRMRVADFVRRRGQPPTWRPAKAHQAALLTRIGHPDLAERLWESTMQLDAPGPWTGLGHAQLAGGFLAEAAKSFSRAAQMGEPGAELHRAEVLAAGGNFAGAAAACDVHLASQPRDLRGILMKVSFLTRAGFEDEAANRKTEAAGAYEQVLRLRPKDSEGRAGRKRLAPSGKAKRSRKASAKSAKKTTLSRRTRSKSTPPKTAAPETAGT